MARYLLSVHNRRDAAPSAPMSEADMHLVNKQLVELEQDMHARGAWVFSGRLHDADTATVVRVSDGEVLTTDGPFAETKDHLGGFYVVEADDLDAALSWAAKVTAIIRTPIEVRPFAAYADEPRS